MPRLRIHFTLTTPITAPQRNMVWLLDRWLAGAMAVERFAHTMTMRYPGFPDWMPPSDLALPLRWDAETTVYATTQARFPLGGEWAFDYRTKRAVIDTAPPSYTQAGYQGSGIFKASHMKQPIWYLPAIVFDADVTDADRLQTLLDILFDNGVGGDRNRGFGHVENITVSPLSDSESCLWDAHGQPTRPIPWDRIPLAHRDACQDGLANGTLRLIHQRLGAPAWLATQHTLCIAPDPQWPHQFDPSINPQSKRSASTLTKEDL